MTLFFFYHLSLYVAVDWNLCYLYDFSSIEGLLSDPLIFLGVFLVILISIAYAVDSASRKKRKSDVTKLINPYKKNNRESLQVSIPLPKNTKSYNLKLERLANQVSNLKLLTQKLTNKNFYCIYCGEKLTQESTQAYNILSITHNQEKLKQEEEHFFCSYCGENITLDTYQALNLIPISSHQDKIKPEIIEQYYCFYCGEKLINETDFCSVCGTQSKNIHKVINLHHII